jgi:hypothetical protein
MAGDQRVTRATYQPGSWVALAGGRTWLLVEVDPAAPAVGEWWNSIRQGASVEEVLGLLLEEGFRAVRSFGLVGYDTVTGAGSVALRGAVRAQLTRGTETDDLNGDRAATWITGEFDSSFASVGLSIDAHTDTGLRLPLAAGVTMAAGITIELDTSTESETPAGAEAPGQPIAASPITSAPILALPVVSAEDVQPVEEETPEAEPELPEAPPIPVPPEGHELSPTPEAELSAGEAAPPMFDHLFGATQRPPSELEALPTPPASAETSAPVVSEPTVSISVPQDTILPTDTMQGSWERESLGASPGLIDAMPWTVGATTTPEPSAVDHGSRIADAHEIETIEGPPVDVTVNRAALLAQASAPDRTGPTVKAVSCQQGHLSPAHATKCRVCGIELPSQDPVTAPRPVLGALRLSTGDIVTLDRGVILGRSPEAPAGNKPDRPHVVKLASPENDISRTHVEVRLDGWHVLVTDLGSTNGTVVTLPGEPPLRLRSHDPLAIEPGTVVSLAEEITFTYEIAP